MNNLSIQDWALRALIVACGVVSAMLLALKGQTQALAPLAIGATFGAAMMAQFGAKEEQ